MDDTELCLKVKENKCDDSLMELSNRHSPLCYKVFQKYAPSLQSLGVLIEDIYDDKLSIIHEAAFTYNPSYKCKFSTWLGNRVRYKCLKEINKRNRSPKIVHVHDEELHSLLENFGAVMPNEDLSTYVLTILESLHDKRIKKIFEYRYFKDWTFTKIGQKMKLSGQAVINLHKLGAKLLKAKLTNGDESDRT